jgi:hypothetical protein
MAARRPNSKMLLVRSCIRASFIENVSSLRNMKLEHISTAQDSTDLVLITNDTVEIRETIKVKAVGYSRINLTVR